jgi:DNA-directed RNA polymerase specialized sigma24 family protein
VVGKILHSSLASLQLVLSRAERVNDGDATGRRLPGRSGGALRADALERGSGRRPRSRRRRRRGYSLHDAQDLTQGFFGHLIEHQIYRRTDQTKGKFRSFLLVSAKHFLGDAYDRERTLKRGGRCEFLPLHEEQATVAEALFQSSIVPGVQTTEDQLFERQWAETLTATALGHLEAEFAAEGKAALFTALEVFVRGGSDPVPSYDQLAGRLEMPAATVRSHVTRLRARYRALLRAELRRTVERDEEVDEELRELLRVLTQR